MTRGAAFYFSNLGADVARCASAAKQGDEVRYEDSLSRAYRTLEELRKIARPEAYEEGLLMLRALALARTAPATLASFKRALDPLIATYAARLTA